MSADLLHPEDREVYIVSNEEDEWVPVPLVSKMVFDQAFDWLNSSPNEYIY